MQFHNVSSRYFTLPRPLQAELYFTLTTQYLTKHHHYEAVLSHTSTEHYFSRTEQHQTLQLLCSSLLYSTSPCHNNALRFLYITMLFLNVELRLVAFPIPRMTIPMPSHTLLCLHHAFLCHTIPLHVNAPRYNTFQFLAIT